MHCQRSDCESPITVDNNNIINSTLGTTSNVLTFLSSLTFSILPFIAPDMCHGDTWKVPLAGSQYIPRTTWSPSSSILPRDIAE